MATPTNIALKTHAARIRALVEAAGAVVVSCSMSTCGFTMRTDDEAEIRHFGSYTRTVRGRI